MRDPICFVIKPFRPQVVKIWYQMSLDQFRVESSHAVDTMAAHNRQMSHSHLAAAGLADEGHPPNSIWISREFRLNLSQKSLVDFENDLQMPGQDALQQAYRPLF